LAGIVLESGKIHFVNSKTAKITDKAGQKLDLKGKVLNTAKDKNGQRFVLFIVERKTIGIERNIVSE
jgi:hypothetical protein